MVVLEGRDLTPSTNFWICTFLKFKLASNAMGLHRQSCFSMYKQQNKRDIHIHPRRGCTAQFLSWIGARKWRVYRCFIVSFDSSALKMYCTESIAWNSFPHRKNHSNFLEMPYSSEHEEDTISNAGIKKETETLFVRDEQWETLVRHATLKQIGSLYDYWEEKKKLEETSGWVFPPLNLQFSKIIKTPYLKLLSPSKKGPCRPLGSIWLTLPASRPHCPHPPLGWCCTVRTIRHLNGCIINKKEGNCRMTNNDD